ncbi:site-2 protease family protein [Acidicapsa acidisoli]|uniref:site-2 protease family protein n=1 Tax=Acidicapsa acidisoli TaxID=1615681 RepID=UPI0021E05E81|nr:site-2 protease family protein [Acidicapsa acidisoli]
MAETNPLVHNVRIPITSCWREYGLPAVLLAVSVVTTTAIGARFMQNFLDGLPTVVNEGDLWPWPWLIEHPSRFLLGWPFSSALLAILLAHEFGHYFACRAHGIRATLPWVLPAPTLSGTAGAVIQIRSRIPNRRALMDVGVSGPLIGYCASLVVIAIGFLLSRTAPMPPSAQAAPIIGFGNSLTLNVVHSALARFYPATPSFELALRHPVLVAGWVGLFITSLNLIPGGQLDGGHILYAISPRLHRGLRFILPIALILAGIFFWIGWVLWGLLLFIPAMRHPRVPTDEPLDRKRILLSAAALCVLALTFSAAPFPGTSILHYIR